MSRQTMVQTAEAEATAPVPHLYPPSWVDNLLGRIDRLPGPAWAVFVLLGVLLTVGFAGLQWAFASYPVGTFEANHVLLCGGIAYTLALIHYLDRYADHAFSRFQPALDAPPGYENVLRYQLTTMPARATWIATLAGAGVGMMGFLIPYEQRLQAYGFADNTLSAVTYNAIYIVFWAVTGVLIYHTFHQLRLMDVIFKRHTRINLFQRRPLYGMAWISAYTGIFAGLWAILGSAITSPSIPFLDQTSAVLHSLSSYAFLPLIPVIFITPLWGVHRLLEAEKDRLLDINAALTEGVYKDLYLQLGNRNLDDVERQKDLLDMLDMEARMIRQTPTWPWQPEVPRTVIATILIPIGIWLVQQVLSWILLSP